MDKLPVLLCQFKMRSSCKESLLKGMHPNRNFRTSKCPFVTQEFLKRCLYSDVLGQDNSIKAKCRRPKLKVKHFILVRPYKARLFLLDLHLKDLPLSLYQRDYRSDLPMARPVQQRKILLQTSYHKGLCLPRCAKTQWHSKVQCRAKCLQLGIHKLYKCILDRHPTDECSRKSKFPKTIKVGNPSHNLRCLKILGQSPCSLSHRALEQRKGKRERSGSSG
jgi:hypothetical protein